MPDKLAIRGGGKMQASGNHPTHTMKGNTMTTLRKQLLIGLTVIGLGAGSLAVHASPGEHMSGGGRHGEMHERMKDRMEKRAADLQAKLNLNADQQKAWDAYIAKMKPADRPQRPSRDEIAKLTAPERMEKMHEMARRGEQQMAARVTATRDFYAVLTPEQRKVFDENFHLGRGHHGKGMRDKS